MRRATRSTSAADADLREEQGELVAGQARQQRPAADRFADLRGDDDAQPVRDHDQQLVAAGMAEAVVDHLEAVEVDEQHRAAGCPVAASPSILSASERKWSRLGSDVTGSYMPERLGILDRGADLGEQGVHRGRELGHVLADDARAAARRDRHPRPPAAGRRARTARGRFRCWDAPTRCS